MLNTQTSHQIIRLKELCNMLALSKSTIHEKQNRKSPRFDSSFPQKVHLGARSVGYILEDIEAWLNSIKSKPMLGGEHD
tara:strand:- start:8677 stop:8913 length:237 start_codon:yes stop_codon:yes gene_type:complete